MTTRAVLFDVDGTLVDSQAAVFAAYRQSLSPNPHALEAFNGLDPAYVLKIRMKQLMQEVAGDRGAEFAMAYDVYYRQHANRAVTIYPGVSALLRSLVDLGFELGVVTSKGRSRLGADLDILTPDGRGRELFSVSVCAEETEHSKPSPQPLLLALKRGGWDPAECVYVGDGPHDGEASFQAGICFIGAMWGYYADALSSDFGVQAKHPSDILECVVSNAIRD